MVLLLARHGRGNLMPGAQQNGARITKWAGPIKAAGVIMD
jgi:hypothetical protein